MLGIVTIGHEKVTNGRLRWLEYSCTLYFRAILGLNHGTQCRGKTKLYQRSVCHPFWLASFMRRKVNTGSAYGLFML